MATVVSRTQWVGAPLADAFTLTAELPLPEVFSRRFVLMPPVVEVRDQGTPWGADGVGQDRTFVTSDGGTMHETIVRWEPPHAFGYRLTDLTGPFQPLVTHVEGSWTFAERSTADGDGTAITWTWTLHPRGPLGRIAVPVVGRLWLGYARRNLALLAEVISARLGRTDTTS